MREHARSIGMLVAVVAYGSAAYWSNRHALGLALLLAAAPLIYMAALRARALGDHGLSGLRRLLAAAPLLLLLTGLLLLWPVLLRRVVLIYLVQHVVAHGALAWLFGRSLRAGRTPLCTEMAAWVGLDVRLPLLQTYTRIVTWIWVIFFVLMCAASILVYAGLPHSAWTFFATVLGPLATAVLFVVENLARRICLPPQHRVGLLGTWRAIQGKLIVQSTAAPAGSVMVSVNEDA